MYESFINGIVASMNLSVTSSTIITSLYTTSLHRATHAAKKYLQLNNKNRLKTQEIIKRTISIATLTEVRTKARFLI